MKIIAVDDERLALGNLVKLLKQIRPDDEIRSYTDAEKALSEIKEYLPDVAFLDIEMPGCSGLGFAKRCKDLCPEVNVIFVTGYSQYLQDAFLLRASGYLIKPVRAEDLTSELDNLRRPVPAEKDRRLCVRTFGSFEVYLDGAPLRFPRAKSKECFAYLVDRKGAFVSARELSAVLFEDKPDDKSQKSYTRTIIAEMMKTLTDAGEPNAVRKAYRQIAVEPAALDCDYYRALAGDMTAFNSFRGEYMNNYAWAEFTLGSLWRKDG